MKGGKTMNRIEYFLLIGLAWLFLSASSNVAGSDEREPQSRQPGPVSESSARTQAYCGIGVSPLDPVLSAHLPEVTEKGRGVVVSKIMKSSPAEQAGLKQYDILLMYNDQSIYSPEQLV